MEDSNPQGTGKTVDQAAASIFGMLEPQQPEEGQVEEQAAEAQEVEDTYEAQPEETEASEETEEVEEPPRYRVKVDNEEMEVTLDELLKGYSRTSDYTKKTQTLAEQRKAVEAERQRIEEAAKVRDQYAQRLAVVEQMLTAQPEENLAELKEVDPIQYAVKVAERSERDKQLAVIRQERQAIAARQQADQQEQLRRHLSSEAEKLKAAIPEMADEVKGEVVRKEIKDFAKSIGFSDQELAQVYDHRAVLTLYEAMQWRKLQQGKPQATKKVSEAPKMLKPGTTGKQTTAEQDAMKKMRAKLAKSGDRRDAARLFEKFI
jgi:hypothetical protein